VHGYHIIFNLDSQFNLPKRNDMKKNMLVSGLFNSLDKGGFFRYVSGSF